MINVATDEEERQKPRRFNPRSIPACSDRAVRRTAPRSKDAARMNAHFRRTPEDRFLCRPASSRSRLETRPRACRVLLRALPRASSLFRAREQIPSMFDRAGHIPTVPHECLVLSLIFLALGLLAFFGRHDVNRHIPDLGISLDQVMNRDHLTHLEPAVRVFPVILVESRK